MTEDRKALAEELKKLVGELEVSACIAGMHGHKTCTHDADLRKVHAAIDRLASASTEVPQGWKLVPIEPTEEMLHEFAIIASCLDRLHHPSVPYFGTVNGDSETAWNGRLLRAGYEAMLAASPPPPSEESKGGSR